MAVIQEMIAAGYQASGLGELSLEVPPKTTDHSTIFGGRMSGKPVIIKRTLPEGCSLKALKILQERSITAREGKVSTRAATPMWVGNSGKNVLELLARYEGRTLERLVRRNRDLFTGDLLAHIFNSLICAAFGLHQLGVVHRDITPSNILVRCSDNGLSVTIIDCSFACAIGDSGQVPIQNANYSPPEQIEGNARAGSDLFSIAGVCHFLATGSPPDRAEPEVFLNGLSRIKMGGYYESSEFYEFVRRPGCADNLGDSEEYADRGSRVIGSLLRPDPATRPEDISEVLLETSSRSVLRGEVVGVIDLADTFILMREFSYDIVSRQNFKAAVEKELQADRVESLDLRKHLQGLAEQVETQPGAC
jgi:serine/threonine protein kinase